MRQAISIVGFAFVLSGVCGAQPYDLRGIKLGITLEEFQQLRFPDPRPPTPAPSVICQDSGRIPSGYSVFMQDEREAGAFGCGYFISSTTYPYLVEVPIMAATVKTYPAFFFVPDAAKVPRLYRIEILSDVGNWAAFWEGFTGRHGPPTTISRTPIRNRMGASFDNVAAIWVGAESSILLTKRWMTIDETLIEYNHNALSSHIKAKSLAKKGRPKDNL